MSAAESPKKPNDDYHVFLNTFFTIPETDKTTQKPKAAITMEDIIKCNTGNLKFGNKCWLRVTKGVWLNEKGVGKILKNDKNLETLNAMTNQVSKMSYSQLTGEGAELNFKQFSKKMEKDAQEIIDVIDPIIRGMDKQTDKSKSNLNSGSIELAKHQLTTVKKSFMQKAQLPSAISVISATHSNLRQQFKDYITLKNITKIDSEEQLNQIYAEFVTEKNINKEQVDKDKFKSYQEGDNPFLYNPYHTDNLARQDMETTDVNRVIEELNRDLGKED